MQKTLTVVTLLTMGTLLLISGRGYNSVQASSHREAPLSKLDPAGDNTDVYAFRSTEAGPRKLA